MAVKVNGTTVIDDSRNVCAVSVCACCIESSSTVTLPSGNTASRPSGSTGELFFDTDEGKLIAHNGSEWSAAGGGTEVDYPLSFATLGGKAGWHQSKFYTCHICFKDQNAGSRIYMLPDGGSEVHQHYDSGIAPYTGNSFSRNASAVTVFRPTEGEFGLIAHHNTGGSQQAGTPGSAGALGIIEWGGLKPSSGVKQLYQTRFCVGLFCDQVTATDICRCANCPNLTIGFFDKNDTSTFAKTRCYLVEAGTSWNTSNHGKHPSYFIPRTSYYDTRYGANDCNCGYVGRGFHCCGFIVTAGGCLKCSNMVWCCGHLYTISGYKHDYFTTSECCATAAASPMTWRGYCGSMGSNCGAQIPSFDPENCRVIIYSRKGTQSSSCYFVSVHCISSTSNVTFACVKDWEMNQCPHCSFGGCAYAHAMANESDPCFLPRKTLYWRNCLWIMGKQNCFGAISLTDGCFCAFRICRYNCYNMRMLDMFVDSEANLRLWYLADGGTGRCCLFEAVMTCAAAACPTNSTATSVRAYEYVFHGFRCCLQSCCCPINTNCISDVSFSRSHKQVGQPEGVNTNFIEYDILNNRVAFNNFFSLTIGSNSVPANCGVNCTTASVVLPLLCAACTSNYAFFTGNKWTCIRRCTRGTFQANSGSTTGCFTFAGSSSRHNTGRQYVSKACTCLYKTCTCGIALCPGFKCYTPNNTFTALGCPSTLPFYATGALGMTFKNDCCYHLSK